jgi:hypothetical protein
MTVSIEYNVRLKLVKWKRNGTGWYFPFSGYITIIMLLILIWFLFTLYLDTHVLWQKEI